MSDPEQLQRELADAWGRYHALRNRKAVRAALAVTRVTERVRRRRPPAPAQPPPAPEPPVAEPAVAHPWPLGHFYSPVPDTVTLAEPAETARTWPEEAPELPGIDWRAEEQLRLAAELPAALEFPEEPTGDPARYHKSNGLFSSLDAWALQAMLRQLRPRRLIEIGSGWSSLVTAQVNREFLDGALDVTCIEPYVPGFLERGVDGIARIVPERVQDVPVEAFLALAAGDVLFIDSSHVVKTGSDARFLYHEVLPRLRDGVVVHVHDVFLPWDYPREWVLAGRGWNEQYVLQSLLQFNGAFEVLLAVHWLTRAHPEALVARGFSAGEVATAGAGSFWMRRRG
jgi:hypothetical protein